MTDTASAQALDLGFGWFFIRLLVELQAIQQFALLRSQSDLVVFFPVQQDIKPNVTKLEGVIDFQVDPTALGQESARLGLPRVGPSAAKMSQDPKVLSVRKLPKIILF
jgi:hypothetical protein